LAGAWAPWAFFGLNFDFSYLNPRKTGVAAHSKNGVNLAAVVDFDARPLVQWLPIGIDGGYSRTISLGGGGVAVQQDYSFGLYYTGRKELALGLEIDWSNGRLESTQVAK